MGIPTIVLLWISSPVLFLVAHLIFWNERMEKIGEKEICCRSIPQSEYQWNGDPAYMLGDYRVPKEMQVTPDGERISMDTLAPHKG